MAAKKNETGKTVSLTDFLAEDGELVEEAPMSLKQSAGQMRQLTWKEIVQPLGTFVEDSSSCPFYLPTIPWAAQEPNIEQAHLPKLPPSLFF